MDTVVMTCESWAEPMTDTLAFGHIHKNRGEYWIDLPSGQKAEGSSKKVNTHSTTGHSYTFKKKKNQSIEQLEARFEPVHQTETGDLP